VDADTAALLDESLGAGRWGDLRRWAGGLINEHGRDRVQAALRGAIENGAGCLVRYVEAALVRTADMEESK